MSSILLVGLNHATACIDLRERFAFSARGLTAALHDLCGNSPNPQTGGGEKPALHEVVILSTCNRLEVYGVADSLEQGFTAIGRYLAQLHGLTLDEIHALFYHLQGGDAVAHLMKVAAGLDSMILGEPQILGQVSDALLAAHTEVTCGPILSHLFNQALHCGKRARTETEIGCHTTSISHAAALLALNALGDLNQRQVLIIGAGEMAELAASAVQQHGTAHITYANRTHARAERLAERVSGMVCAWTAIVDALATVDVVISATSAPHPVITYADTAAAMARRNGRPLLLLDIALPRDIEVAVDTLPGVKRFDLDHLRDTIDANLARRMTAVPAVEYIAQEETGAYLDWMNSRQVLPAILELRRKAEMLAGAEVERTLRRIEHLEGVNSRVEEEVAYMAHRIVNKLLHDPTVQLKVQAVNGNGAVYSQVLETLFALGNGSDNGADTTRPH